MALLRKILILWLLPIALGATNYYVKAGGSDIATGTSDATAWATISKVNSEWSAGTFAPADTIFLRRGDLFSETIIVTESGVAGSPIVISAYGNGEKPIITGLETISEWTSAGGGIYYSEISVESAPNMVLINGENTPMGRFPDSTYLILDSSVGTTSITDAELNSSVTDWSGAELVIRKNRWITDRCPITDHTNQTLTYTTLTTYTTSAGYGYFIQNDLRTLTTPGEWFWDSTAGRLYMYFGASHPSSFAVECSVRNNNINAISYDYLSFNGLHLNGANFAAINLNRNGANVCNHVNINDCKISFSGGHGIYAQYPQYLGINGCEIVHANINGVYISPATSGVDNYYTLTNNTIDNIYLYSGMGTKAVEGQGIGINATGPNTTIAGNRISNIGYIPINTGGTNLLVQYNYIDTYGFVMDDCGGIYIFNDNDLNKRVYDNIVLNAIGAGYGSPGGATSSSAHAFYSDGGSSDIVWTGNIAGNITGYGFHANMPVDETFSNNTLFECAGFLDLWKFGYSTFFDGTGIFINGLTIQDNVFVSSSVNEDLPAVIRYRNSSGETYNSNLNDEITHIGYINNNHYYTNTECHVHIIYYPADLEAAPMSILRWRALYGHDSSSTVGKLSTYTVNSVGSNLISNSTFDSNITGWTATTGSAAWINTNELGGGGSIRYTGVQGQYMWYWWSNTDQISSSISGGVVDATKHYILRLRGKSSVDNKTWSFKLRSTGTGYPTQRHFTLADTASNKEVLLSFPYAVSSGATIRLKDGDIISVTDFDNIYLYEASITLTDFDSYLHFLYNDTEIGKTFTLSNEMIDAEGTEYSGTIQLAPFDGLILIGNGTINLLPPSIRLLKNSSGIPLRSSSGNLQKKN